MERVSGLTSSNLWNALINQQTWGGVMTNVKKCGAEGDEKTDDTTAIQSALNSGNSTVFIPDGDYRITGPLSVKSNTKITGSGKIILDNPSGGGNVVALLLSGVSNVVIEGIEITTNGRQDAIGIHMIAGTTHVEISNVYVHDFRNVGISSPTGENNDFITVKHSRIMGCKFGLNFKVKSTGKLLYNEISNQWSKSQEYIDKGGVWDGSSTYYDGAILGGTGVVAVGNYAYDNGQSGLYAGLGTGFVIEQNITVGNWNCGLDFGVTGAFDANTNRMKNFTINGNYSLLNHHHQLNMTGMIDSTVTSNVLTCLDTSELANFGIILTNNSHDNVIMGNRITSGAVANRGMSLDPTNCTNNHAIYNKVSATTPYFWSGSGNVVLDTTISSDITSAVSINLTGNTGFDGRHALELLGSADNGIVEIYSNKSFVSFVDGAGAPLTVVHTWQSGTTALRPSNAKNGQPYIDTDLNKPIWFRSTPSPHWIDATGATV